MKLTCDLCGGELQINSGGKSATCANCGLGYTMERLREKLNDNNTPVDPPQPVPVEPEPVQPEPVVLTVLAAKKRPGMAWGRADCVVQQGTIECGMPYYAHINSLEGDAIQVGSLSATDVSVGGKVKMLLYCDKSLLPTIDTLYVFPEEPYDDGDEELI